MMSFQDAVRTCFQKYIVISGRAQRSEYWWFVLFTVVANAVLNAFDAALFGTGENAAAIFGPLFALATFLPSICAGGRRLHDRDMSAWWLLLILVPVIGVLILLVIFIFPGTPGPNRFGPDPLGGSGTEAEDRMAYSQSSVPRAGHDE